MFRKMLQVACVAAVLSMAIKVDATEWANTTQDGKWSTAANWSLGAVPVVVVDTNTGAARINLTGSNACTIDGTQPEAVCQWLFIGESASGTLNVVDGGKIGMPTWGPGETLIGTNAGYAGSIGVLNVDGGIAKSECWRVGSTSASSGTINITNGGYVETGIWSQSMHVRNTGRINIIDGTLYVQGADQYGEASKMVIDGNGVIAIGKSGKLMVYDDQTDLINGYITSGNIRPINSHCSLSVSFDLGTYKTMVTVTDCPTCTTYSAGDFNKDCYVDFADFTTFIANWLNCTDSLNADCL